MTIRLHRGDLPNLSSYKRSVAVDTEAMGLDPNRLSYFYGGLDQKLVGVEGADPIWEIIA